MQEYLGVGVPRPFRFRKLHVGVIASLFAIWAATLGLAGPATAQTFTVQSISPADLGNVASGATGDTTFQLASPNGNVSKMSGNGARVSTGTARALVTVRCGTETLCGSKNAKITITRSGTLVKRARALSNFTVSASGATASIVTTPTTGNTITFELGPIGTNATKTFWLGFDYPIAGDDSGLLSGAASSGFTVTIARTNNQAPVSLASIATATAFRPLNMTLTSNLAFGTVSRPRAGTGSVTIDALTGGRSVTGAGVQALANPIPSKAGYTVSGEGGQTFSIAVPTSFAMTGPGGTITVTTSQSLAGTQALSGALGVAGGATFNVGGSFPVSASTGLGSYTGTFVVTVQNN